MGVYKRWALLCCLTLNLVLPVFCLAAVSGQCSNCHTMHNLQDGSPVAYTMNADGEINLRDQPFGNLLKTDCLGCHTSAGAETIVDLGGADVPIVFNLLAPTYPPDGSAASTLAGGNFHWMLAGGDAYGHNVAGIGGDDLRFPPNQAPGGAVQSGECVNCHGSLATAQSSCEGCHVAEHHAGGPGLVADRTQGWYRFLGSVMQRDDQVEPTPEGVVGIEAADWEQNPLVDQHNVYQGSTAPYANYLDSGSMSQKCTGCHGLFHDDTVATSTWIRHPVDVAIPDAGEFTGLVTYDPMVPVARPGVSDADANFTMVDRGSDLVSCISCHRPHGSPYPALLRWGYRDWPGTDSYTLQPAINGCAVCHTNKG